MVDNLITLYEDNEIEFLTNGLGSLRDAVKCTVYEEINGEYELTLRYPITGRHYSDLQMRRIIFAKPNPYSYAQPFRIYAISKPHDGIVTVSAHHISYDLSGYPITPFNARTLGMALGAINFQMTTPLNNKKPPFHLTYRKNDTSAEMNVVAPCSARALLGGSEGTILDTYRGEYEWDRWDVILHDNRGADRGVRIAYGKNLTSLEQEENCENVWTGVYPYWYGEVDGEYTLIELSKNDNEKIFYCDGDYKHERILILDLSSAFVSGIPTPEDLREEVQRYIKDNEIGSPKVSLTVSFVNLADTTNYADIRVLEQVRLCDTVTVDFPKLGVSSTSKVISTTYNVLTNKYESIELGEAKSNLAATIADQASSTQKALEEQKSALQRAIDSATKLISGGLGGYVILHSSDPNSKYPDEILILDTPDINTAKRVWRWNQGGLGYSKNGYQGPFELAMTMDGAIVADFITAGELNGALIKAGTLMADVIQTGLLTDKKGFNFWNLDTGEFQLASSTLIGGSTVQSIASTQAGSYWSNLTQSQIFNKLTQNGTIQGLYMTGNQLYINANYINSGTMSAERIYGGVLQIGKENSAGYAYIQINTDYGTCTIDGNSGLSTDGSSYWEAISAKGYGNVLQGVPQNRIPILNAECNSSFMGATFPCNVRVTGGKNFTVTGTKNREIRTKNYGDRLQYCYETSTPMFGDVGFGQIDEDGVCVISIDDIFSETVSKSVKYAVFLQKEGPGDLWVSKKNADHFVIEGTPGLKFVWELKGYQRDYECIRLERSGNDIPTILSDLDYSQQYADEIDKLIQEQEDELYGYSEAVEQLYGVEH